MNNDKDLFLETVTVPPAKVKKKYYKRIPKELQKKKGAKKGKSQRPTSWWDAMVPGSVYFTQDEPKTVTAFAHFKQTKVKTEVCQLVRRSNYDR
jgi:hypothetical protein